MPSNPQDIFLEAANVIGDRICREALWDADSCYWSDEVVEVFENGDVSLGSGPVGADIYSGACGIALFLTRLYGLSPREAYRVTAEGAIEYALSQLVAFGPEEHIGFYGGYTGVAYALVEVGEAFANERFAVEGLAKVSQMKEDDPRLHGLDVIFGSAGAIASLLAIFQRHPSQPVLDLACRYGDHLIETAHRTDLGWSWNTIGAPNADHKNDMVGFSHGTAGIGWALLELSDVTGDNRFRSGAEGAFRYERHWFSPEMENWPDLRDYIQPAERFPVAWCHGAPGIGLSRLRAYEITRGADYLVEAQAAVRTTIKQMSRPLDGGNYSICHGVAGNADVLIYASQMLGDPALRGVADQRGAAGIARYGKGETPWPCGTYSGRETMGLMQGLSGIGYFCLRLYDSDNVPPLTIIAPKGKSTHE